ncbi:MAG: CHASE2 domain-containing protein [Candidatus Omnitrophica bacterium]|nr:CHASE2 domain-containing protein [Candidatus Omnitrophota bacterium]
MTYRLKSTYAAVGIGLTCALLSAFLAHRFLFLEPLHWKIFDRLNQIHYTLFPSAGQNKDILLVVIDNPTLENMPSRWPFTRADFAQAIEHLYQAGARVVAFDFVFLGKSDVNNDALLEKTLTTHTSLVLANSINEEGSLEFAPLAANKTRSGIVTKIQDSDGTIRRDLTYLVDAQAASQGYLSWCMQTLDAVKPLAFETINTKRNIMTFVTKAGDTWSIPIAPTTHTFLIRYRYHTTNFIRLPFYRVVQGTFDPAMAKNKIVIVGFLSSLFGDVHKTPIGWLPGITLNANSFLTLYHRDFMHPVPWLLEIITSLIAVAMGIWLARDCSFQKSLLIILAEIVVFLLISFALFANNFIWHYALTPIALVLLVPGAKLIGHRLLGQKGHTKPSNRLG